MPVLDLTKSQRDGRRKRSLPRNRPQRSRRPLTRRRTLAFTWGSYRTADLLPTRDPASGTPAKLPPHLPPDQKTSAVPHTNKPLPWSPLTESNRRPSPYHLQFRGFADTADLCADVLGHLTEREATDADPYQADGRIASHQHAAHGWRVAKPASPSRPRLRSKDGQTIFTLPRIEIGTQH